MIHGNFFILTLYGNKILATVWHVAVSVWSNLQLAWYVFTLVNEDLMDFAMNDGHLAINELMDLFLAMSR